MMGEFKQKENFRGKVKKCFTLLLCLCMVAVLIPVSRAQADTVNSYEYEYKGTTLKYNIDTDSEKATVDWIKKDLNGEVEIPDTIEYQNKSYAVVALAEYALSGKEMSAVTIGNNVTSTGVGAFEFCTSLEKITICNSSLKVGDGAFKECRSLASIYIPCGADTSEMFASYSNMKLGESDTYGIYSEVGLISSGQFYRTHNDIVYTATNQTISATCPCKQVNAGSITLVAPSDTSYTGSAVEATYTGSFDTAYVAATPVIKYAAKSGSALTNGKTVEPGTYTASITVGTATVSVEYTISGETNSSDENENSDGDDDDYDTDSDDATQTVSSSDAQVLNVTSDNVVASDAPVTSVTLENSTDELLSSGIFTTAEKRRIANGNSAKVYVNVDSLSAENVSQVDRNAIENAAAASLGDNYSIQYMDMSLFKQVGSTASQKVSKTGTDIKVTVGLSENMINKDENVSRKYVVISLYDGEAATIEPTYEPGTNKLTFSTNSFSTFAIAFTQEAAMGQLSASSPKTGDTANIPAMLAIMAVAGMMVCLARSFRA